MASQTKEYYQLLGVERSATAEEMTGQAAQLQEMMAFFSLGRQYQHTRSQGGTPLGGTPEGSSHKGYGLGAMVNILSSALSGGAMVTDPTRNTRPGPIDIGHFFLAMDPGMFRDTADFQADVAAFCDTLRATRPADPAKPVQVAGDPERRIAAARLKTGIPVGPNLLAKVKEVALASGADWIMDG